MRLVYYIAVSLLLTGCGGEEMEDLHEFVKNSGVGMRGKIEPPPEVIPYEPFVYNNEENLPDPFRPRKQDTRSGGLPGANQPDFDRPKEPLEEFPLEGLHMVGYLYQNRVGYAVIRDPEGKLHRVKAGNHIGMNFGLIKEVNETGLIVKEMVPDSAGDWSERVSSLQLLE